MSSNHEFDAKDPILKHPLYQMMCEKYQALRTKHENLKTYHKNPEKYDELLNKFHRREMDHKAELRIVLEDPREYIVNKSKQSEKDGNTEDDRNWQCILSRFDKNWKRNTTNK